jgi:hypothetical protein
MREKKTEEEGKDGAGNEVERSKGKTQTGTEREEERRGEWK